MRYILGMLLGMLLAAGPVWADHDCCKGKGGQCPITQGKGGGHDKSDESCCPITSKTIEKAKFLLEHADEIGLDEAQVKTVKGIKMDAKKAAIQQKAGMEIWHMDMKAKLSEPVLDVDGLNKMMDEAAAGMTTGGKAMIATYAKLRAVLSEAQSAKAKEIWKKSSR